MKQSYFPKHILTALCVLLGFSSLSLAQSSGYGGVYDNSVKALWLDAGSLSLNTNDPVDNWQDLSGLANNAVQTDAAIRPVFIQNGFGGRPVVRFDGTGKFLQINNHPSLDGTSEITLLVVARPTAHNDARALLSKRTGVGNAVSYSFFIWDNKLSLDVGTATRVNSPNNTLPSNNNYILSARSRQNEDRSVSRNGSVLASSVSSPAVPTNNNPLLVGRLHIGDSRYFQGDIAEVIILRQSLNRAQMLILENILAHKYGLATELAGNYQLGGFSAPFVHDITGVGSANSSEKHVANLGNAGALYLSEWNNGFDGINEFVFAGHDGTPHALVSPSDISSLADVDQRWDRTWRIERRENGVEGAGNTPISIGFDFAEAQLTPDANTLYVLLYKPNPASPQFDLIPGVFASVAGDRVTFNLPNEFFSTGYYTVGRFTGSAEEYIPKTWTSFQSGNWTDPNTWRNQFGQTGNPAASITRQFDNIVIQNAHTITVDTHDLLNNDLDIRAGGILNIGTTRGHLWQTLRGQGLIRINGDYFPEGNASQFVSAGGGTTEYYGTGSYSFETSRQFNHLTINLSSVSQNLTLLADLTVQGNFHIDRGHFIINNNTSAVSRSIWVSGNMRVASSVPNGNQARLSTGEGDARHFVTIRGNFTANGESRFCNLDGPNYTTTPTDGYADVIFNHPSQHQLALINAPTDFYRIEIDKGVNDKWALTLRADAPGKFRLLGRNNFAQSENPPNITNPNALGLLAGTVVIGDHIEIPQLRSGSNQNYNIDRDAQIIVDGGRLLAPSNTILAIVVYGRLTLNNGELLAFGNEGVTIREFGTFRVNGGNGQAHIVRTSIISGVHRGAYVQTGGTLRVNGPNGESNHYRFSLPYPTNSFTMTGGDLIISNPKSGGSGDSGGILIAADKDNITVEEGTVRCILDRPNKNFIINSTAPFYNLILERSTTTNPEFRLAAHPGGGPVPAQPARPLQVLNKLTILGGTTPARLNLNGNRTLIHGDFEIQDGAGFLGAGSHLAFVGDRSGVFDIQSATSLFEVDTLSVNKAEPDHFLAFQSVDRLLATEIFRVTRLLQLEQGILNYQMHPLVLTGDLFLGSVLGPTVEPGRLVMQGTALQQIRVPIDNSHSAVGRLEINNSHGVRLYDNSIPQIQNLILTQGVFDLQQFGITLNDGLQGSGFSKDKMIATAGNHSDAGLIRRLSSDGDLLFPMGTTANDNPRYTPLEASFSNVSEPVYVQMNPVAMELPTLANALPDSALRYYWRIRHSEVTHLPTVDRYSFTFDPDDLPPLPLPEPFVPGKIVNLERSHENEKNFDQDENLVVFDGNGEGFSLEIGEYTAAQEDKFVGKVREFFSRETTDWTPKQWNQPNTWSFASHTGDADTGGAIPGPGDLVRIGFEPTGSHKVQIGNYDVQVGGVTFVNNGDNYPWLYIRDHNTQVNLGNVAGEGRVALMLGSQTPVISGDFGEFSEGAGSEFVFQSETPNGVFTLPSQITVFPNVRLESTNDTPAFFTLPDQPILVKGNFWVTRSIEVRLSQAPGAELTILGNLRLGEQPTRWGRLRFAALGQPRTLDVRGNVLVETASSELYAENAASTLNHVLRVGGDILQFDGSINLFRTANPGHTRVALELTGNSDNVYERISGNKPGFYRLIMNKGTTQAHTFAFVSDFDLWNDASGSVKPITLLNGTLELQQSGIEVWLNSAGAANNVFAIPSTAGLILSGATARASGNGGIRLDGLLRLEGEGKLLMTDNSYIEYGSGSQATLEVHDDAQLVVAAQLRSSSTFETGVLKYLQTGGSVTVGRFSAPVNTRAVFEIFREGSSFRFLGGDLRIVRSHNNNFMATLLLDPSEFEIGEEARLYLGLGSLNYNDVGNVNQILKIESKVPLPHVKVEGGGNTLEVWQYAGPLTIAGDLEITTGTTFQTNVQDLTLQGDLIRRGTFTSSADKKVFMAGNSQHISGSVDFHNLVIEPETELLLDDVFTSHLTVQGNMEILSGNLYDQGNLIELKGNLMNQAAHISSSASVGGLLFSGNQLQTINGNGTVGRMVINNTSGVRLLNSLFVDNTLVFQNGILDIQGFRLTLGPNHSLDSTGYSFSRMIRSNGNINDAGVRYFINGIGNFLLPLGVTGKYTPMEFSVTQNPATPWVDVQLIDSKHPNATEPDNLGRYWKLVSQNMSNFAATLRFHYLQADVTGNESDYYPARLLNEAWSKLPESLLFENDNYFEYPYLSATNTISGEYTAGRSIPDVVLRFRSIASGSWGNSSLWTNLTNSDPVPAGGPLGQIVEIAPGTTVTTGSDPRIAYRTEIEGTLDVGTTSGHYLGEVSGNGRLYLESATLPIGKYDALLAPGQGTVEYGGTATDYTMDPAYWPNVQGINRLVFSGSGRRTLPARDLTLYSNLEIRNNVSLDNQSNQNYIRLGGDLIKDAGATFEAGQSGNAVIYMQGTTAQSIQGAFTGNSALNILSVANPQGVIIEGTTEIQSQLNFVSGRVFTTPLHTLRLGNNASVSGASATSFVQGPLQKAGTGGFVFPVGYDGRLGRVEFRPEGSMAPGTILEAAYFAETHPSWDLGESPIYRVSSKEYWSLESVGAKSTPNGRIRLYFEDSEFSGVTHPQFLLVSRFDTNVNKWIDQGYSESSQTSATSGWVQSNLITGTGLFTFGSDQNSQQNNPLPVELLSFSATVEGKAVRVQWITASELNNDFFTVERSSDGVVFEPIGFVAGSGTTSERRHYSLVDEQPLTGISYYRLRQTDFDGTSVVSAMVAVQIRQDVQALMQVFPNPVREGRVVVLLSTSDAHQEVWITLHDLHGRQLRADKLLTDDQGRIEHSVGNLQGLPSGIYLLVVQNRFMRLTERIVIR
ncbi:MAG: LamG-like jellyroll fold domain-containing protein [Bacteroidales bacterium]